MSTDLRSSASEMIASMRDRLLHGLAQAPDDRLGWSPAEGARPPLELVYRGAFRMKYYAGLITGDEFDRRTPPPPDASRAGAAAAITAACDEIARLIAGLSDADLERQVTAPWGAPCTLASVVNQVVMALGYAQGQLNYVQICYGDMNANIPDSWKQGDVRGAEEAHA